MRLLIVGNGRMGQAIAALASAQGDEVVACLGASDNHEGQGISHFASTADVAVEFTVPAAARANVIACLHAGLPVVTGTTGWYQDRPAVEELALARQGALLVAPNFSVGVALFLELAERAGQLFGPHAHFAPALIETHHAGKKDAPSGTAIALADAASAGLHRPVPSTSVRVGSVPGTHTLLFDGPFEQISLTHEARDRRVFADGALRAAHWLVGRRGVFTMRDLIRTET